jgi:hypothetical protein
MTINEYAAIDPVRLTELLRNPIARTVGILDLVSLSILELLEYNLERREINSALSEGVITIDKTTSSLSSQSHSIESMNEDNILLRQYYFYNFLNSKVRHNSN